MPREKPLNEFQKGQIFAYKNEGKGVREIARQLRISPNAISKFIRNPERDRRKRRQEDQKNLHNVIYEKSFVNSKIQVEARQQGSMSIRDYTCNQKNCLLTT